MPAATSLLMTKSSLDQEQQQQEHLTDGDVDVGMGGMPMQEAMFGGMLPGFLQQLSMDPTGDPEPKSCHRHDFDNCLLPLPGLMTVDSTSLTLTAVVLSLPTQDIAGNRHVDHCDHLVPSTKYVLR